MKPGIKFICVLLAMGILLGTLAAPLMASAQIYDERDFQEVETSVQSSVTVAVGETMDLSSHIQCSVVDDDAYRQWYLVGDVVWNSSNEKVATVDEKGILTGKRNGSALLTAKFLDNTGVLHLQTMTVRVKAGNTTLPASLANDSFSLLEGRRVDLNAIMETADIDWTSTNAAVATVDEKGLVETHGIGSCYIKGVKDGQEVYRASIRVTSGLLDSHVNECTISVAKGSETDLTELLYPNLTGTHQKEYLSYVSSDTETATVQQHLLKAVHTGKCVVLIHEKQGLEQKNVFKITITVS